MHKKTHVYKKLLVGVGLTIVYVVSLRFCQYHDVIGRTFHLQLDA